jgi:hypothetical protein
MLHFDTALLLAAEHGHATSRLRLPVVLVALIVPLLAVVAVIMIVLAVQIGDEASNAGGA